MYAFILPISYSSVYSWNIKKTISKLKKKNEKEMGKFAATYEFETGYRGGFMVLAYSSGAVSSCSNEMGEVYASAAATLQRRVLHVKVFSLFNAESSPWEGCSASATRIESENVSRRVV